MTVPPPACSWAARTPAAQADLDAPPPAPDLLLWVSRCRCREKGVRNSARHASHWNGRSSECVCGPETPRLRASRGPRAPPADACLLRLQSREETDERARVDGQAVAASL